MKPSPHRLTKKIVENDGQLHGAVLGFLHSDRQLRKTEIDIMVARARLRGAVGAKAWEQFAALESLMIAREMYSTLVVARWAYEQGFKSGVRQP